MSASDECLGCAHLNEVAAEAQATAEDLKRLLAASEAREAESEAAALRAEVERLHAAAQPATAPTRTEAEQAVLDAMSALTPKNLEELQDNYVMTDVVDAELARRGLKQ